MTNMLMLPPGKGENTAQQSGRTLTPMQAAAVRHLSENIGSTKGEALRAAGYSEETARTPGLVFNSPYVMKAMEEAGLDLTDTIRRLKKRTYSRRLDHMVFPLYNEEVDGSGTDEDGDAQETDKLPEEQDELTNAMEEMFMRSEDGDFIVERGRAMSDKQIVEMLEEQGCRVRRIQHGRTARHVYFWADNDKVQLEALDMMLNLYGAYAPKKSEVKATVGVFRLADIRSKMEEKGMKPMKRPPVVVQDAVEIDETTHTP